MSTEHILAKKEDNVLSVYEMSNEFTLYLDDSTECTALLNDLTTEEMKALAQQLVNVISYYDFDYEGCKVNYE